MENQPHKQHINITTEELKLFIEKSQELKNSRYYKELPKKLSFNINFKDKTGTNINTNIPDWDILKAFVVTFRLFYYEKEPIYLPKFFRYLKDISSDSANLEAIKSIEKQWNTILLKSPIQLILNSKVITPRELVNLFIYSDITHVYNKKRREKLRKLREWNMGLTDFVFHITILDLSICILKTKSIVERELQIGGV